MFLVFEFHKFYKFYKFQQVKTSASSGGLLRFFLRLAHEAKSKSVKRLLSKYMNNIGRG